MTAKIIVYTGAHGTGKTTAVNQLALSCISLLAPYCRMGIIKETAKLCPMPVYSSACAVPTETAQQWIFAAQMQAEMEACARYDVVISDRSLVDCIAYTRYFGYYGVANAMENLAALSMHRYRQVVFHRIENHDYHEDDGFRAMDATARSRIERIMLETYRRMGVKLLDSANLMDIFPKEQLKRA